MESSEHCYPFVILGHKIDSKIVMIGSLNPMLMSMECSLGNTPYCITTVTMVKSGPSLNDKARHNGFALSDNIIFSPWVKEV